jgi:hypothetical protein
MKKPYKIIQIQSNHKKSSRIFRLFSFILHKNIKVRQFIVSHSFLLPLFRHPVIHNLVQNVILLVYLAFWVNWFFRFKPD